MVVDKAGIILLRRQHDHYKHNDHDVIYPEHDQLDAYIQLHNIKHNDHPFHDIQHGKHNQLDAYIQFNHIEHDHDRNVNGDSDGVVHHVQLIYNGKLHEYLFDDIEHGEHHKYVQLDHFNDDDPILCGPAICGRCGGRHEPRYDIG